VALALLVLGAVSATVSRAGAGPALRAAPLENYEPQLGTAIEELKAIDSKHLDPDIKGVADGTLKGEALIKEVDEIAALKNDIKRLFPQAFGLGWPCGQTARSVCSTSHLPIVG
jgi:hypothetical protein